MAATGQFQQFAMSRSLDSTSQQQQQQQFPDYDEVESMEPDIATTTHMKFVDGRCGCCPYGYHIDLDFLRYLDSLNKSGDMSTVHSLTQLKQIHDNKRKLRKSMEVFLRQQQEHSAGVGNTGATQQLNADDSRQLMSIVEREDAITSRFLQGIDMSINDRLFQSDSQEPRYRSETELQLGRSRTLDVARTGAGADYGSQSSLSVSSGPPSPRQPTHSTEFGFDSRGRSISRGGGGEVQVVVQNGSSSVGGQKTTTITTTRTMTSGSHLVNDMESLLVDGVMTRSRPGSATPTDMTTISSATLQAIREQMAASLQRMKELEEENRMLRELQVRMSVLREEKKMLELQLRSKQVSTRSIGVGDCTVDEFPLETSRTQPLDQRGLPQDTSRGTGPDQRGLPQDTSRGTGPDQRGLPQDTSRGTGPLDQRGLDTSRGSGLRSLNTNMNEFSDIHIVRKVNLLSLSPDTTDSTRVAPSVVKKPSRTIGVGDGDVFAPDLVAATVPVTGSTPVAGSGAVVVNGNNNVPVRVHEREVNTEQNTEVREKEIKTVFLSGATPGGDEPVLTTPVKPQLAPKPKSTRSIGVGSGNVFDVGPQGGATSDSLQVHEKELRTVYIDGGAGGAPTQRKSTRNVGILCKSAMRDVGVMYHYENEVPMTRNIAVGVGEIGVNEVGVFGAEGSGGMSDSSVHITNMALQQLNMAAFQSRNVRFTNEQLTLVLDSMLKKNLRSVAVQCRFATVDQSVSAVGGVNGSDEFRVSVGCSDDTVDVDVVPIRQFRSVAIDNRPSVFHRACGADIVYHIDSSTNTHTQGVKLDRSSNTDVVPRYPAATNTEAPSPGVTVATETDSTLLGDTVSQSVTMRVHTDSRADKVTPRSDLARQKKRDSASFGVTFEPTVIAPDASQQPLQSAVPSQQTLQSAVPSQQTLQSAVPSQQPLQSAVPSQQTLQSVVPSQQPLQSAVPSQQPLQSAVPSQQPLQSAVPSQQPLQSAVPSHRHQPTSVTSNVSASVSETELLQSLADVGSVGSGDLRLSVRAVSEPTVPVLSAESGSEMFTMSRSDEQVTGVYTGESDEHLMTGESDEHLMTGESGGGVASGSELNTASSEGSVDTQCSVVWRGGGDSVVPSTGSSSSHTVRSVYSVEQPTDVTSRLTSALDSGTTLFEAEGNILGGSSRTVGGMDLAVGGFDRTVGGMDLAVGGFDRIVGGMDLTGFGDFPHITGGQKVIVTESRIGEPLGERVVMMTESRSSQPVTSGGRKVVVTETTRRIGQPGRQVVTTTERHSNEPQGGRVVVTETTVERRSGGGAEVIPEVMGSMSDGTLRSIMKTSYTSVDGRDQSASPGTRRKISFIDEQHRHSESPVTDPEVTDPSAVSGSDDSQRSSASFEEGTYDGRRGYVTYTCKDEGADMYEQHVGERYSMSAEMSSACSTYAQWLDDSTQIAAKELNASLAMIQQEWFTISSHKLANPVQLEDCLTSMSSMSRTLLQHIVNMADANGNTALHYAVSHGNFDVVSLILDTEVVDVDQPNRAGYTAVMLAALTDIQTDAHRDIVQRLFDIGNVNLRATQAGQTALMLAVSHGKLDVSRMLIDAGADVNVQDDDGSTALMCASEHGHVDIVKLLLAQQNCDANITDNDGSTAMSIAMDAGHRDIGVLLYAHVNFRPGSPKLKKKSMTTTVTTTSSSSSSHSSVKK